MHDQNGFGVFRFESGDLPWGDVECVVDFRQHGPRAHADNGGPAGNPSPCGQDYFVAGPDLERAERRLQRGGTAGYRKRVFDPDLCGEFFFEIRGHHWRILWIDPVISKQIFRPQHLEDEFLFLFADPICPEIGLWAGSQCKRLFCLIHNGHKSPLLIQLV